MSLSPPSVAGFVAAAGAVEGAVTAVALLKFCIVWMVLDSRRGLLKYLGRFAATCLVFCCLGATKSVLSGGRTGRRVCSECCFAESAVTPVALSIMSSEKEFEMVAKTVLLVSTRVRID